MFSITKLEYCPMCGMIIHGHGSNQNKKNATEIAFDDLIKNRYLHYKIGLNCKDEFKMYEDDLKDYLRPKYLQFGFRIIKKIVAYING